MPLPAIPDDKPAILSRLELTPTSLGFPGPFTFEEWMEAGHVILFMATSAAWWVADWILYGEREYGEMYAQAVEETSYSYGTLRNFVRVGRAFDVSRRHDKPLTFAHHETVAALEPADQDRLLDAAESEHWSSRDLRQAVQRERLSAETPAPTLAAVSTLIAECIDALMEDRESGVLTRRTRGLLVRLLEEGIEHEAL